MEMSVNKTKKANGDNLKYRFLLRLAVFVVVLTTIVAAIFFLPVKDWLIQGLEWTRDLGVWGPVFVVLFYILACIFFLPGSIITLGTGFVFKLLAGTIAVSIGSTLGACAAFLLGRTIARGWVAGKVSQNAKFAAIDEAVGKQGFKIVLLTRLTPLFPFNLLNYAFGLTKVKFWQYALGSWIGMLPGTILYVYIGASLGALAEAAADRGKSTEEWVFFGVGLAVAVAVVVVVTRIARKALREAVSSKHSEMNANS